MQGFPGTNLNCHDCGVVSRLSFLCEVGISVLLPGHGILNGCATPKHNVQPLIARRNVLGEFIAVIKIHCGAQASGLASKSRCTQECDHARLFVVPKILGRCAAIQHMVQGLVLLAELA